VVSLAAKRATSTTPVVFVAVRAPVERGLVPSLARPGGNVTGLSTYATDTTDPKLFEIAKELLPRLARAAVLVASTEPPGAASAREKAAQAVGVKVVSIPFTDEKDFANFPAAVDRSNAQLLIAPDNTMLYNRRKDVVRFAEARRLLAVYGFREAAEDGGLIALGTDLSELARRAAIYVDRILKGAKPGELPVEQPTRLQLVINMKAAKALGLTIPQTLLLRADQIID
jgi:putative ABC transport system substrate-binding protein